MDSFPGKESTFLNNRNKRKAEMFLKEKHVMPLMNHLTSALLFHEPDDPVTFIVRQVEEMIEFRDHQSKPPPILFTEDQLTAVFKSIDFLKSGSIDLEEYFKAMNLLGLNEDDFNQNPQVDENNRILSKTFVYEAKSALMKQMITMVLGTTGVET